MHLGFWGFCHGGRYTVTPTDDDPMTTGTSLTRFIHHISFERRWDEIRSGVTSLLPDPDGRCVPIGGVLTALRIGTPLRVKDGMQTAKNSRETLYGMVINLDTTMLEIYWGNQYSPQTQNPFGTLRYDRDHYPCAKIVDLPFSGLTVADIEAVIEKQC